MMTHSLRLIAALALSAAFLAPPPSSAAHASLNSPSASASQWQGWDLWETFAKGALEGGRVVNRSSDNLSTTSEGESYALFFALAADDRENFARILSWTEDNLCGGDCTKRLPAWLWGRRLEKDPKTGAETEVWGILDRNNAADSDLWIAYALLEAGRLWKNADYLQKGRGLSELILSSSFDIPGLGRVIPPGEAGFSSRSLARQNPSYYPPFLLKRLEAENPAWRDVRMGAMRTILRGSRSGFSADWADFDQTGTAHGVNSELGSWDAVRVYLWAGMTSAEDPDAAVLKRALRPMIRTADAAGIPPERVEGASLTLSGPGPDAFAACLLPWTRNTRTGAFARTLLAKNEISGYAYYKSVLTLFGLGFDRGVFAFDAEGRLIKPRAMP
ncbi:cellulose synthase complex periplasmic endoglucanase BcsZ [uncultured Sutterella sp.]|uniref:cellulose synthase complex periplasmic endoglucanase BcsZ n=1 Tax=uncultured Sutterella sp. TaxID=286133 RepID=UPI0026370444|nr:cellulose synthase complex periplasmic endoglucanase BcsZ [uncultured Sutterella sp.]